MIKTVDVGESNRLIVILTDSMGVITAFAGGVRKPKSRLSSGCGLFVYSQFDLTESGGKYRVDEAVPKELFYKLRFDIGSVALASYFCELLSLFAPEGSMSGEFLRPALNSFYLLSIGDKPKLLIKAVTEMRLMMLAGYTPDISDNSCGHDGVSCFDYLNGNIICDSCARKTPYFKGHKLNQTLKDALRYITESDIKSAYNFTVPQKDLILLSQITESYIIEQTEYKCKTLAGVKELL